MIRNGTCVDTDEGIDSDVNVNRSDEPDHDGRKRKGGKARKIQK